MMDIYRERAHLVAHLAILHPAVLSHSDPDAPEWPVVTIDTPAGQLTWHISTEDRDLFTHVPAVPVEELGRFTWDGHDTETKYARLRALTTSAT
ncbi:hypothetical protein ACFVWN_01290 [Nocardiopsis flavescens]|uniref:WDGH domain-containing protein n=1 Tax=Nocardiopsis flavescens TaxID=758803 RepID=UPI00365783AC